MCEFLSFLVGRGGEICVGSYTSHNGIVVSKDRNTYYREAEWVGDKADSLTVRVSPEDIKKGEGENWWKAQVLGNYKTRAKLIRSVSGKNGGPCGDNTTYTKFLLLKNRIGEGKYTQYAVVKSDYADFSDIHTVRITEDDTRWQLGSLLCPVHHRSRDVSLCFLDGTLVVWGYFNTDYAHIPQRIKNAFKDAGLKRGRNRYYL